MIDLIDESEIKGKKDFAEERKEGIKCFLCGSITTYVDRGLSKWRKYIDNNGTIEYICYACYEVRYYQNHKNDVDSSCYESKIYTDWRNGNLDPSSTTGKGFIGTQIICRMLDIDDCNIKMNNFGFWIDTYHKKYGYLQVKTSSYSTIERKWLFEGGYGHVFDTIFLVCMDEHWPWRNVIRVYMIPYKDVYHLKSISISRYPSRESKWDRYRVIDEKLYNDNEIRKL